MLLACAITVTPSPDYTYLVGSVPAPAGTPYRWLRNGAPWRYGTVSDLFLLHADGSLEREPAAGDAEFGPGRWDTAFSGVLTYAREGNLDLREGTIEMWVALRAAPTDALYTERDRALFQYRAGADSSNISYSRSGGLLYGGGTVAGAWQSAYGSRGSIRAWKSGEWHHIAFTYSASANRMQFYVDGVLAADTNERRYVPPRDSAETFRLGDTAFWMDAVRISSRAMDAAEIRASAQRQDPPRPGEVWLPLSEANPGDTLTLASEDCPGAAFAYGGIPISNPNPPSTLLAPDTTSLPFSVESAAPASCGYSVNKLLDYDAMTPFDRGQGGTTHQTVLQNLSSDTKAVNDVYVRCNSDPAYALRVQYRARGYAYPPYPRKGNLWGAGAIAHKGLEYASRIDLYLGADFTAAEIRRLRELNPHILVLTSINTVEHRGLPEDYYLHDVRGRRIEVWPGIHRLNLTKPYVAEYQARFAYQQMLDSGLMTDGCFFDNFFTTQS